MILLKYFKLEIPFATKAYIQNKSEGIKIKGKAIFIFDKFLKKYIHEYLEIESANFRLTDLAMIKPTSYYKDEFIQKFRTNYLDKWSFKSPNLIKKTTYKKLNFQQIQIINKFFKKNLTTIKRMFSLLSGSNISGAKTNPKASPLRCLDHEFWDCNFANVLKEFKAKKMNKNYPKNIPVFNLNYLLNDNSLSFEEFKKTFIKFNPDYYSYSQNDKLKNTIVYYENNDYIDSFKIGSLKEFNFPEEQLLYIDGLKSGTINFTMSEIKQKLRYFFSKNVNFCLNNKIVPEQSTSIYLDPNIIDNAHIIQFSNLIESKQYLDAIDPFNCLRIDANTHKMFDRLKIYFDQDGNIRDILDNHIKVKNYLDISKIPQKTKEYLIKIENNIRNFS